MAWDDSSLTITVNPLDVCTAYLLLYRYLDHKIIHILFQQIEQEQESPQIHDEDEDSDSSDDGSSYHDDGESSEDETEKSKARRELEWDDSTLNF